MRHGRVECHAVNELLRKSLHAHDETDEFLPKHKWRISHDAQHKSVNGEKTVQLLAKATMTGARTTQQPRVRCNVIKNRVYATKLERVLTSKDARARAAKKTKLLTTISLACRKKLFKHLSTRTGGEKHEWKKLKCFYFSARFPARKAKRKSDPPPTLARKIGKLCLSALLAWSFYFLINAFRIRVIAGCVLETPAGPGRRSQMIRNDEKAGKENWKLFSARHAKWKVFFAFTWYAVRALIGFIHQMIW